MEAPRLNYDEVIQVSLTGLLKAQFSVQFSEIQKFENLKIETIPYNGFDEMIDLEINALQGTSDRRH